MIQSSCGQQFLRVLCMNGDLRVDAGAEEERAHRGKRRRGTRDDERRHHERDQPGGGDGPGGRPSAATRRPSRANPAPAEGCGRGCRGRDRSRSYLLETAAERSTRCVEGRRDGPVGDPKCFADRRVVEVGVIAQEDGRPLPLRKARERARSSASRSGWPFVTAGPSPSTGGTLRRTSDRAEFSTMRQTHASSGPSPRNAPRLRTAVANASCTTSRARSASPVTLAATRTKTSKRLRYSASSSSSLAPPRRITPL